MCNQSFLIAMILWSLYIEIKGNVSLCQFCKGADCESALVYRYCMMLFPCYWVVDNSDSPSVVEPSQQRCWVWLYSFIIPCLWLCGVSYALDLLPSLLHCCWELFLWSACMSWCSLLNAAQLVLMCSPFRSSACLSIWASAVSFLQCIVTLNSGIALLGLCILG